VFNKLAKLVKMHIINANFSIVQSNIFIGLANLKELIFNDCFKIKKIEEHAFKGLSNLEILDISKLHIDILYPQMFDDISNLKELIMVDFQVKNIQSISSSISIGIRSIGQKFCLNPQSCRHSLWNLCMQSVVIVC
jgi:Leucine-rich repeat (LRR) protein